jgi:hypothetical protein
MDRCISNNPTYVMLFLILAPSMYPSSLCVSVVVVPRVSKLKLDKAAHPASLCANFTQFDLRHHDEPIDPPF